jgi:hypothetical protein
MDAEDPAPSELSHGSKPFERPRSVAQIIGEALDLYQGYPLLFLTLALGVIGPYELAVLAITGEGPFTNKADVNVGVALLKSLLDLALVGPLVSALHIHAVTVIGSGEKPRLGPVTIRALRVLPVVAAAVIVSTLGIGLGFLALIVPGVLLALRWSVVAQVAALEHLDWGSSLGRSRELTRGHYGHIFGLLLIAWILATGITLGVRPIPLGSTTGAASVAVGIATRTITASFSALTLALLYFDLRARQAAPAAPREYAHVRDLDEQPYEVVPPDGHAPKGQPPEGDQPEMGPPESDSPEGGSPEGEPPTLTRR